MGYTLPRLYKLFIDPNFTDYTWSGIREVKENMQLSVFPNPASSELNIAVSAEQKPISNIHLFDVAGRMTKEITQVNALTKTIDLNGMANGIYLLSVKLTNGTTASRRVVVEQ
jgi:hypothetical protein